MDIKTENTWLMFGDCLERMKEIPDNSVDLILTDPPYGTIRTISTGGLSKNDWDVPINTKEMMKECHRVLRPKGTLCLFSQDPYTIEIMTTTHGNLPFAYRYTWEKNHFGNAMISSVSPVNVTEDICVYFKVDTDHSSNPLQKMFSDELARTGMSAKQLAAKMGSSGVVHHFTSGKVFRVPSKQRLIELREVTGFFDWSYDFVEMIHKSFKDWHSQQFPKVFNLPQDAKYKSNILKYKKDGGNFHPTQKPVALLEDLVSTYTNEGDCVLDFTMGSGSSGVACKNTKRNFIGIEMNGQYYEVALNRLSIDDSVKPCHTALN